MSVDTAKVEGRRTLKFNTIDDILADVERLNLGKVRTIGNWSSGQILRHLSLPMIWCLDGAPVIAPWYIRVFGWFIKNRFPVNPMSAGFKLPKVMAEHLIPGETTWEEGLAAIRTGIQRMKTESQRKPSPFLGELTREQWDQVH